MANIANTEDVTRSVVILGYSGVQALDLVGPFDVFTGATLHLASQGRTKDGYQATVVSIDGQPVATLTGLEFVAQPPPDPNRPIDTIVIPGGIGADAARANPTVVDWIRTAAPHARRVVTVCTGAFIAAQAGLLDGCPATTHWASAGRLAEEYRPSSPRRCGCRGLNANPSAMSRNPSRPNPVAHTASPTWRGARR